MIKLRDEEVVWQSVEGEIVVLDLRASRYLTVNGSGALLWSEIVQGSTRAQLAKVLTDRYTVTTQQAEQDVDIFVSRLAERGLLE